jgi:hypothetical protein
MRGVNTSRAFAPEVQSVFDRLNESGHYIKMYPSIVDAGYTLNFAIVFARLMYHEHLRLISKAKFFSKTDDQLAHECGMRKYKFVTARDTICAQGVHLFNRELHGSPPISHYAGNHDRIQQWLTAIGIKPSRNLGKTSKLKMGKPANRFAENPSPLKNLEKEVLGVDGAARARAMQLLRKCDEANITGEVRLTLAAQLMAFTDALEIFEFETDRIVRELNSRNGERIKNASGLQVTRLRDVYVRRTGNEPKHVDDKALELVRELAPQLEMQAALALANDDDD